MKKIIFIAVLAALGGGGFAIFKSLQKDPERMRVERIAQVATVSAKIKDVREEIVTNAEVRPLLETEVKAEINGRIVQILVEDGQEVLQGQPLVELDRQSLQANLEEAERSLESFELRLEQAQRAYDRLAALRTDGFANEADFLDAKTRLDLAKLDLEIRETRLQEAQEDHSRATVVAPHDGVVIDLNINEGQVINGVSSNNSGTKLMAIADLERMYLLADLGEFEVGNVFVGKKVSVAFNSIKDTTLAASVSQIAASARKERNRPVFAVEFTLDEADERVKPGINGEITIPVAESTQVVTVPIASLFYDDGDQAHVFVKEADGFTRRDVEVGLRDIRKIEIKEGLAAEDEISRARPPRDAMVAVDSEPAA